MTYPSHADYDLAVRYLGKFVFDPVLKSGTARSRDGVALERGGAPLSYPGGFAKVYVVDCGAQTYALRVWLHEISDAAKRYRATTEFLKSHRLPFFVGQFEFVANGILVQGRRYPVLRMEWVDGYSLRDFIKENRDKPKLLRTAAAMFVEMVKELHKNRVAHGDLQSENIVLRIRNNAVEYKLIDYDTLVVPQLLGQPIPSTGLDSYQHPNRAASKVATEKDDHFSELVIYLTLLAISENPDLWHEFPASGRDKELIFQASDFVSKSPSALFKRIYSLGGEVQKLAVVLWNYTRCPDIKLLLPLEQVIELINATPTKMGDATTTNRRLSAFDELLSRKLSQANAGRQILPDNWLDGSQFHGIKKTESKRRKSSNQSISAAQAPTLSTKLSVPDGSHPVCTQSGTFAQTLARMQNKAKGNSVSSHSSAPSHSPQLWTNPAFIALCAIFLILALIGNCEHRDKTETKASDSAAEHSQNSSSEVPAASSAPTVFQQPTPAPSVTTTGTGDGKPVDVISPPALSIEPIPAKRRADDLIVRGWTSGQQRRYTDAEAAFAEAAEIDPTNATAWYDLGWANANLGRYTEAVDALKNALSIKPNYEDAWYMLAIGHAKLNDAERAANALSQLSSLNANRASQMTRQFSLGFVQRMALAQYPDLAVPNSRLNREFVRLYSSYKSANPTFFNDNDWPIVLARQAFEATAN